MSEEIYTVPPGERLKNYEALSSIASSLVWLTRGDLNYPGTTERIAIELSEMNKHLETISGSLEKIVEILERSPTL